MQIVVLATKEQKAEVLIHGAADVVWIEDEQAFAAYAAADAFVDLTFINTPKRNALLAQRLPKPVIVNSVTDVLPQINLHFIRINGWPAFLSSPIIEAAGYDAGLKAKAEEIFARLGRQTAWLPDEPGFVTARVVSMIINEAYLALNEGVSTKDEVDTAMKLGTAYPFGPFEWAQNIGLKNIVYLLQTLSQTQPHYSPSALLVQEASTG